MDSFHTDQVFSDRENLTEWVQNMAWSLGYVVVIKRTKTKNGYISKIIFMCDRGGVSRGPETSTRNTGTRKTNCPFELFACYYKSHDVWRLKVKNDQHNHEPAMYMEGHPYARRFTQKESKMVAEMKTNNVPPRDMLSSLKAQNEKNVSTIKTVYNECSKLRMEERAGRSQMQLVFGFLHSKGYVFEYRTNDTTNALEDLFFVHPTSLQMWRAFPQVMMMDATYKTNKYNMPFLEIVGVSSTNTTFCIAFGFMDQEKESNYVWALSCLKAIIDRYDSPCVIVTDRELALMNACEKVFPSAVQILCRWHISQSIIGHCKQSYKTDAEWTSFMRDWGKLIDSPTWETYLRNYAQLESRATYQPGVLDYLNRVWLDKYKEKFVSAWTDQMLNFHNHTNNRTESQHAKLKTFLGTQHGNLDKFFNAIEKLVASQHTALKDSLETSRTKLMRRHNIPHFKGLCGNVSHHALEKIRKELDRPDAQQITEDDCGCQLRRSCGLPCAHEIANYLNTNQVIPLASIDKFWRKLDLIDLSVKNEDVNFGLEEGVELLKKSYAEQSNDRKRSYVRKLWDIFSPSTTKVVDPAVHKNTRGRPRLSKQKSTNVAHNTPPIPTPTPTNAQPSPTQFSRSRSFSTYQSDYKDTYGLDLNEEPQRHSTYSFREPSMSNSYFNQQQPNYTSNPFMNQIPRQFQPYVEYIQDVRGDGNCGFRSIASSLGRSQDDWLQIRYDLHNELLAHPQEYAKIYDDILNRISHSLNFSGTEFAPLEHWLIMPDTAILIANRYRVIVIYLSNRGPSTWFPFRYGPQDIPNPAHVVIAHVYPNHYVMVRLRGAYPFPPTLTRIVRAYRSIHTVEWERLYSDRLNAYVHNAPYNFNTEPTIIHD